MKESEKLLHKTHIVTIHSEKTIICGKEALCLSPPSSSIKRQLGPDNNVLSDSVDRQVHGIDVSIVSLSILYLLCMMLYATTLAYLSSK